MTWMMLDPALFSFETVVKRLHFSIRARATSIYSIADDNPR
jgi:hypothetical protein